MRKRVQPCLEPLEDRTLLSGLPARFASAPELEQFLLDEGVYRWQGLFGIQTTLLNYRGGGPGQPSIFAFSQSAVAADGRGFSQTNVQVQGVDEADLVKTDGQFFYVLHQPVPTPVNCEAYPCDETARYHSLVIVNAWPAERLSAVSRSRIEGSAIALYRHGDRVTVVSRVFDQPVPVVIAGAASSMISQPIRYQPPRVKLTVFDVANRSMPRVLKETYFDGNYVGSRSIGGQVYLVVHNFTALAGPETHCTATACTYETEAQYRARLKGRILEEVLPHYYQRSVDGTLQQAGLLSQPEQLRKSQAPHETDLISVLALDVTAQDPAPGEAVSILGTHVTAVYAAPQSLYLVSPTGSLNGWSTLLHKFQLDAGMVTLAAQGTVPGQVLNQFSLDEHNGYLRIATTLGWGAQSRSQVSILGQQGDSLAMVGRIENLGPGERIYAVRFLGTRAFVVTFVTVDPLFALDLSNPANPRVAGELKVPGFSEYLQPIDEQHLLAIGRGPTEPWQRFNGFSEVQLSLFKIADLANPQLLHRYSFPSGQYSWSEAATDHHAVGYYPTSRTLAIPFTEYAAGQNLNRLWVFQIDVAAGFHLLGQVQHADQVRRSLRIEDKLYSLATNSIKVQALANPATPLAEVSLRDTGLVPNQNFVSQLYNNLLGRTADAQGLATWTALLDRGVPRGVVSLAITQSTERQTRVIQDLYRQYLDRMADPTGLTGWVHFLKGGGSLDQVKAAMLGSEEYGRRQGDGDAGFLQAVYRDVLQRGIDQVGATAWAEALTRGSTRHAVASALVQSQEAQGREVRSAYQQLLRRAPDQAGLEGFLAARGRGLGQEALVAAVAASEEYYQRRG